MVFGRVVAFDAPVSRLHKMQLGRVDVIMRPITTAWNRKMLRAINADDARVVQKCLCDGQDPNTAFPRGFTALSYSARNSATACVTLLLTAKASPNISDNVPPPVWPLTEGLMKLISRKSSLDQWHIPSRF